MRFGPLKLKTQLYCGEELAMGPGKADLLDAIAREGSISAAARSLGMSYRRAWSLVDTMNRCWLDPLVEAKSGGGSDRGAAVTPAGREILTAYRTLETALEAAAVGSASTLTNRLRAAPRAADKGS